MGLYDDEINAERDEELAQAKRTIDALVAALEELTSAADSMGDSTNCGLADTAIAKARAALDTSGEMSGAREIVTAAIPCNIVYGRSQAASAILSALTAAGYRILAPGEVDRETVKRCAKVAKAHDKNRFVYGSRGSEEVYPSDSGKRIAAAIRTLTDGGHDA